MPSHSDLEFQKYSARRPLVMVATGQLYAVGQAGFISWSKLKGGSEASVVTLRDGDASGTIIAVLNSGVGESSPLPGFRFLNGLHVTITGTDAIFMAVGPNYFDPTVIAASVNPQPPAGGGSEAFMVDLIDTDDGFYWKLDQNSGAAGRTAPDESANGNDGTDNWPLAQVGQSPAFSDEVDFHINCVPGGSTSANGVFLPNGQGLNSLPWSMGAMVHLRPAASACFVIGWDNNQGQIEWLADDRFRGRASDGFHTPAAGVGPYDGDTVMAIIVATATTFRIYVDGDLIHEDTGLTLTQADEEIHFGEQPTLVRLDGGLDFCWFLGREMTQLEIDDYMALIDSPMRLLVEDLFDDTNGVTIDNHTPDTDDVGGGWALADPANMDMEIDTNELKVTQTDSGIAVAVIDSGKSDVSVRVVASPAGGSGISAVMRYVDENNYWFARMANGPNVLEIIERNASVPTVRASAGVTVATGTVYRIIFTAIGQRMVAHCGQDADMTAERARVTYTSATFQQTETHVGIRGQSTGVFERFKHFVCREAGAQ